MTNLAATLMAFFGGLPAHMGLSTNLSWRWFPRSTSIDIWAPGSKSPAIPIHSKETVSLRQLPILFGVMATLR